MLTSAHSSATQYINVFDINVSWKIKKHYMIVIFFFRSVKQNVLHIAPLNILFAWFHLFYVSHRQTRTTITATRTRLQLHCTSKNTAILHHPVLMKMLNYIFKSSAESPRCDSDHLCRKYLMIPRMCLHPRWSTASWTFPRDTLQFWR